MDRWGLCLQPSKENVDKVCSAIPASDSTVVIAFGDVPNEPGGHGDLFLLHLQGSMMVVEDRNNIK